MYNLILLESDDLYTAFWHYVYSELIVHPARFAMKEVIYNKNSIKGENENEKI